MAAWTASWRNVLANRTSGGYSTGAAQPPATQFLFDEPAVGHIDITEKACALGPVALALVLDQVERAGLDEGSVGLGRGRIAGLRALRRVDADVADALDLVVDQDVDGVAVDDFDEGGRDGAGRRSAVAS